MNGKPITTGVNAMLKDLFIYAQILTDRRIQKMFWNIHKELSRDNSYHLVDLIRALYLAAKDERIVKYEDFYVHSSFLPPIPSKAALQVFNAVPDDDTKFSSHTRAVRTAPISLYLAVTGRCGYNCSRCSAADRNPGTELEFTLIADTIDQLQDMGVGIIGFTGGEPLLRKDIVDIVKCADDRSVTYLFSSGSGLSQERADELKRAGLFAIGISLDSTCEHEADMTRGCKGAFKTALTAIENARQAGLYVMLQTVVDKEMIHSDRITDMVSFAEYLGVQEIRFLENLPAGRFSHISADRLLSQDDREKLILFHRRMNRPGRRRTKVTVFAHAERAALYGCGAGTQHSYIDAAGNLCPCDFVPLAFGNIREKPIKELWPAMNKLVGRPRERCMILELSSQLQDLQHPMPITVPISQKIVCEMRTVKSYPGFYRALKGDVQ